MVRSNQLRPNALALHGGIILLYHRVIDLACDPQLLCVSPTNFDEHLEVVRRHYKPMTLSELTGCSEHNEIPDRAIAVTFDDGYFDNHALARPLLERHDVPATIFVTARSQGAREFWWDELEKHLLHDRPLPDSLEVEIGHQMHRWKLSPSDSGSSNWNVLVNESPDSRQGLYLFLCNILRPLPPVHRESVLEQIANWAGSNRETRQTHRTLDESGLRKIADGGLISIGAHTITHSVLATQSIDEQRAEIAGSRHRLEEIIDRDVRTFSYPFGTPRDFGPITQDLVRESGFQSACANSGRQPRASCVVNHRSDPFALPRLIVPDCSGDELIALLNGCCTDLKTQNAATSRRQLSPSAT